MAELISAAEEGDQDKLARWLRGRNGPRAST
jgi:hypothetical protein